MLVLGNLVLVPNFGLAGAALAALIAMTVWSAGWWFVCLKLTGINVAIWSRVVGSAAPQPAS